MTDDVKIVAQTEGVVQLPAPQSQFDILPDTIRDALKQALDVTASQLTRLALEIEEVDDPGGRQAVVLEGLYCSALDRYKDLSGADSAQKANQALAKAMIKVEAQLDLERRRRTAEEQREKQEFMQGVLDSVAPEELSEHIQLQDEVLKEQGAKTKDSAFMKIARKRASKKPQKGAKS